MKEKIMAIALSMVMLLGGTSTVRLQVGLMIK